MMARAGGGCGLLALSSLLSQANEQPVRSSQNATSVIWLFMNGGPSSIDLFQRKPALSKWDGKKFPDSIETLFPYPGPIMKSPFSFKQYGKSGAAVSEVLPHLSKHVDDLTFLHACRSEIQNHAPACYMMNSGIARAGAPCIGSWMSYGMGRETEELPNFVVMYDHRTAPEGGSTLWDASFLPGEHQGVPFQSGDSPILYLKRPHALTKREQGLQLELLKSLNQRHAAERANTAQLEARMKSFETAFKMQSAAPGLVDLSSETRETQQLYGLDDPDCRHFGAQLLTARRLVERGVRFVQIYHGGWDDNWDQHVNLETDHRLRCKESDQPIAALLTDLKQRGMLENTLVVWGGEFGRTPTSQDRDGRDHNPFGFTMWLAGGRAKRGFHFGETDEFGYQPVRDEVTMHDLHATLLHLTGQDHEELTYFHNGRHQSLTNDRGSVVREIVA